MILKRSLTIACRSTRDSFRNRLLPAQNSTLFRNIAADSSYHSNRLLLCGGSERSLSHQYRQYFFSDHQKQKSTKAENEKNENVKKNEEEEEDEEEDSDDEDDQKFPLLMNFIPRGMPNLFYSVKNFYIINFVIRNQIDRNFDFGNFIKGAKHAFIMVSSHLANNRLDDLSGLVHPKALEEIKENYKNFNVTQQRELKFIESDIVLSFAHNIRVETLTEEFTGTRKHVVYCFVVFDCIRNLEEILREKAAQRGNARDLFREFNQHKYVCNYEFKREYVEGGGCSDWIITKLLHIPERELIGLLKFR